MSVTDRKGKTPCIYWASGRCTANQYFSESSITCYNSSLCDGAGTCIDCTKYSTPGLGFANVSKSDVENSSSDLGQIPANVAVYNLRAKIQKCCNWNGAPKELSLTRLDTIKPAFKSSTGAGSGDTVSSCTAAAASDWQIPWYNGSSNNTIFPCNGAKQSCPFYTGPKFQYITDEKLEEGKNISAAQIMELRYYSKDWSKEVDARVSYEASFNEPDLWAWSGRFDDDTASTDSIPGVKKVTLFDRTSSTDSFEDALSISAAKYGQPGTQVAAAAPAYPTLVKDLADTLPSLDIRWPVGAKTSPYVFKTFRIGQNKTYVIVVSSSEYNIYAINISKHSQGFRTDEAFVQYMLDNNPDDIYTGEASLTTIGTVFVVDLLYKPDINEIKVFTTNPFSTDESMYTDTTFVKHKFYHAHLAQTSFTDNIGQSMVEPWVDRFLDFDAKVDIKPLSLNKPVADENVLWDTVAYSRPSIFPVQKAVSENISVWEEIYCNVVALTISNVNANVVQPWTVVSGTQKALNLVGTQLGVWCDRSANPNASATSVEMTVVSKSENGVNHPANVLFVKPTSGNFAFDKRYDRFRVTFAYTEYRQGPPAISDFGDLKYPALLGNYITMMPYKVQMNTSKDSFTVEGLRFPYFTPGLSTPDGYLTVADFEEIIGDIESLVDANERIAMDSFARGGDSEAEIKAINYFYGEKAAEFGAVYTGKQFGTGDAVTLSNFCSIIEIAGYYEGSQDYRVVFKDDDGRPIGVKRVSLLMQSAIATPRDVEIYYRWRTQAAFVDPRDHASLLAMDYRPMLRSNVLREVLYEPKCGDHSLQVAGQTFYAKTTNEDESLNWQFTSTGKLRSQLKLATDIPGPLWYPYKACSTPRYHEDDPLGDVVLCSNYVEGFGAGNRRYYWERMRGSDIFWTTKLGTQDVIGCTWSWVEGNFQSIKDPVFAGFTRIRSGHLLGSFQTDREAVRLTRHYSKRNISVRTEWVRLDGYNGSQTLSAEGTARMFNSDGTAIADEKPVWVHIFDDLSVVNRTTSLPKHPFSNVTMVNSADHVVNETFDSTRRSLSSIATERHLIKDDTRDENGNIVFNPTEPLFSTVDEDAILSKGSDIFWVYKKDDDANTPDNIAWAWLERQKPPVRATSSRVGGVFLYNPSINVFKKNMESASFMPDGVYSLVYTPPKFNSSTGVVLSNPTLSLAGGPPREIDWGTGILGGTPSAAGKDPYAVANHTSATGASFQIFGKVTSNGNGFLADSSGKHSFENDGTKLETFRGLAVKPEVILSLLPYHSTDILSTSSVRTTILYTYTNPAKTSYEVSLRGSKTVEKFEMGYHLGPDGSDKKSVIPQISLDGKLPSGVWVNNIAYLVAYGPTKTATTGTQEAILTGKYTHLRINIGRVYYKHSIRFSYIRLYVREPIARTERVTVYDQKVNISYGDMGNRYSSDLLYYYGRTFADFGLSDVNYDETSSIEGPTQQDLKWQSRSVKDLILHYNFMDPTGTVYDYPKEPIASIDGVIQAAGGSYFIDTALSIHTKGQTLVTSSHVDDPLDAQASGLTWSDTVANNENSSCTNARSEGVLDESLQECLYKEAGSLLSSLTSTYTSFWHPDETAFFKTEVGVSSMPTWTLTVRSSLSEFKRVMRHPAYGCHAKYTNEYHDGKVHSVPPWRAVGHLMYLGKPVWNWSCTAIIMQKIGTHLGENLFEKAPSDYVISRTWPPDSITNVSIEEPPFYYNNRKYWDNPATYIGGTMSPGIPTNISQAMNYAPGGVPRNWLKELSLFPETKAWPLDDSTTTSGFKK